ncbi:Hypp1710 [Branchiostoma lanceolatum]|uniref:Hypp1710 protein n=1 Tax=Branchiostoma lanceolatum TaxID=7740 RepID=A0A8J9ZMP8_BRALA|nr:Hypp1710 [Branchiostoma lanceolatum]
MAKRKPGGLDEVVVTMSTVRELLDNQKKEFTGLMELQERNFKSFIETVTVTTNRRLDDLIREVVCRL